MQQKNHVYVFKNINYFDFSERYRINEKNPNNNKTIRYQGLKENSILYKVLKCTDI